MRRASAAVYRARVTAALALLCALCTVLGAARAAEGYSEDAIKAAYLYRFAGYVEWPEDAGSSRPFTIAVLGDEAVAAQLRRLLPDHPIQGRPAQLHVLKRIRDVGDAEILYIGAQYDGDVRAAIAELGSRPVLIVTDDEKGLDEGGTINFLESDRRVRFEVSLFAADRSGLRISSELLSVAARVEGGRLHSDANCELRSSSAPLAGPRCPERLALQ